MVHIAQSSPFGARGGYREQNRQLARELNEYKERTHQLEQSYLQLNEELHKCNLEIIQLRKLEKYKDMYDALRRRLAEIIDSTEDTVSITGRSTIDQQSIILPLPQASDIQGRAAHGTTACGLDAISEHEEDDDEEVREGEDDDDEGNQDETVRQIQPEHQTTTRAQSPINSDRTNSFIDSLEPADVTSVPSLHAGPMPEQASLSIWRCLDDTNTPKSAKDKSMFQSTPKKPVLVNASSRVNMSPLVKESEQQDTMHPIENTLDCMALTVAATEIVVQQQSHKELEVKEKEAEKEVKKTKRKASKQKEEDAKRPRTYNLRKRN